MDEKQRDLLGQLMAAPCRPGKKSKRREPVPRGYYFHPGTGPAGETCGSCAHLYRNRMSKTYLKCAKNKQNWTGGGGSDVRARSPACKYWEKPADSETKP